MSGRDAPRVALDGPSSSGKSSVGRAAARALSFQFFDTGLLYRALARAALDRGIEPSAGEGVAALAPVLALQAGDAGVLSIVLVDGADVSGRLHTPDVDVAVPLVAARPEVRAAVLALQREIARHGEIILAGRDIGTVVLPDAEAKLWLDATAETRAARRARERGFAPESTEAQDILLELRRRDLVDSTRAIAPSRPAAGAVHIDTDDLDFEATVAAVVAAVERALEGAA